MLTFDSFRVKIILGMNFSYNKEQKNFLKGATPMISIKHDDFSENYDLFAKLCEITSEPLRLVKDGRSDLIIMNAGAYERRKKMLDLREKLLKINEDEFLGIKGISLEELEKYINELEEDTVK